MAHSERLYYTDGYLKEFSARVVRANPDPRGARVYLDRTAFYPESGGQPSDRGTLAGIPVLDVIDEGEDVAHLVAVQPEGEAVEGRLDWDRRFDHMQQHTGQHILSAAFERIGGYKTASFHLGTESSSIDLDSDRVGTRQIEQSEDLANSVVFEDRPVQISFRPAAETQQLELRKPTAREGDIRLVDIEGFDLSACGGTHVSRTGSVGIVCIRKVERAKASDAHRVCLWGAGSAPGAAGLRDFERSGTIVLNRPGKRSRADRQTSAGSARGGQIFAESGGGLGGTGGRTVVAASPGEGRSARCPPPF